MAFQKGFLLKKETTKTKKVSPSSLPPERSPGRSRSRSRSRSEEQDQTKEKKSQQSSCFQKGFLLSKDDGASHPKKERDDSQSSVTTMNDAFLVKQQQDKKRVLTSSALLDLEEKVEEENSSGVVKPTKHTKQKSKTTQNKPIIEELGSSVFGCEDDGPPPPLIEDITFGHTMADRKGNKGQRVNENSLVEEISAVDLSAVHDEDQDRSDFSFIQEVGQNLEQSQGDYNDIGLTLKSTRSTKDDTITATVDHIPKLVHNEKLAVETTNRSYSPANKNKIILRKELSRILKQAAIKRKDQIQGTCKKCAEMCLRSKEDWTLFWSYILDSKAEGALTVGAEFLLLDRQSTFLEYLPLTSGIKHQHRRVLAAAQVVLEASSPGMLPWSTQVFEKLHAIAMQHHHKRTVMAQECLKAAVVLWISGGQYRNQWKQKLIDLLQLQEAWIQMYINAKTRLRKQCLVACLQTLKDQLATTGELQSFAEGCSRLDRYKGFGGLKQTMIDETSIMQTPKELQDALIEVSKSSDSSLLRGIAADISRNKRLAQEITEDDQKGLSSVLLNILGKIHSDCFRNLIVAILRLALSGRPLPDDPETLQQLLSQLQIDPNPQLVALTVEIIGSHGIACFDQIIFQLAGFHEVLLEICSGLLKLDNIPKDLRNIAARRVLRGVEDSDKARSFVKASLGLLAEMDLSVILPQVVRLMVECSHCVTTCHTLLSEVVRRMNTSDTVYHFMKTLLKSLVEFGESSTRLNEVVALVCDSLSDFRDIDLLISALLDQIFSTYVDRLAPLNLVGQIVQRSHDRISIPLVVETCARQLRQLDNTRTILDRLAPLLVLRKIPSKLYAAVHTEHLAAWMSKAFTDLAAALAVRLEILPGYIPIFREERKLAAELVGVCFPLGRETYSIFESFCKPAFQGVIEAEVPSKDEINSAKAVVYSLCIHVSICDSLSEDILSCASFAIWVLNLDTTKDAVLVVELQTGCVELLAGCLKRTVLRKERSQDSLYEDQVLLCLQEALLERSKPTWVIERLRKLLENASDWNVAPKAVVLILNSYSSVSKGMEDAGKVNLLAKMIMPGIASFILSDQPVPCHAAAFQVAFIVTTRTKSTAELGSQRSILLHRTVELVKSTPGDDSCYVQMRKEGMKLVLTLVSIDQSTLTQKDFHMATALLHDLVSNDCSKEIRSLVQKVLGL